MLCIIFTKKKLLAGVQADSPQLLQIKGRSHINIDSESAARTLEANLDPIIDAYTSFVQKNGMKASGEVPTSLAFPVDVFSSPEKQKIQSIVESANSKGFKFIHSENLVVSFLYGVNNQVGNESVAVLESMDDYTNLCYHLKRNLPEKPDLKELGASGLFTDESFEFYPFKDFGFSSGSEKVLNELMTEFSAAGLSVDFKGQTQLARQLEDPAKDHVYNVSKNTDTVSLEAEVKLSPERYNELLTTNKEKLGRKLTQEELSLKGVDRVVLLGSYLKNDAFQSYLDQNLKLGSKLVSIKAGSEEKEFATIIAGLTYRANQVLEAERIRAEELERRRIEAEKRAKIAAELKVKKDREALLSEIAVVCTDPTRQAEYEDKFIEKGVGLGIPEVVVRWNITEVLSKIELKKEGEGIGLEVKDESGKDDIGDNDDNNPLSNSSFSGDSPSVEPEKIQQTPVKTPPTVAEPRFPMSKEPQVEIRKESTRVMPEANRNMGNSTSSVSGINASMQTENRRNTSTIAVADAKTEQQKESVSSKFEPVLQNGLSSQSETKANGFVETKTKSKIETEPEPIKKPVIKEVEEVKTPPRVEVKSEPKLSPKMEPIVELKVESKPVVEPPKTIVEPVKSEPQKPEVKPEVKKAPEPEPQIKPDNKINLVPEEKVEPVKKLVKTKKIDKSLSDIFIIKGALPDNEFSTKKVIMNGESEPKVVKVLGAKESIDPNKVARFRKLYEKEIKYYLEISEISEAAEGLYYYRNYLERTTLKDYVKKIGLDTKLDIDSLSSTDLKFILQVFKEVRELPVGHASLTEDNILVISKRKWNLQKNVEIKFVGFTVEDATQDEMIEQTHEVFSRLLGKAFYKDFREKFQL